MDTGNFVKTTNHKNTLATKQHIPPKTYQLVKIVPSNLSMFDVVISIPAKGFKPYFKSNCAKVLNKTPFSYA